MIRSTASCFVLLMLALLATPRSVHAAESYDNCTAFITSLPAVISTQGTWCFKQDLNTAITSGNAITINTNNVTIDCNNFKLGGLAAGLATQSNGIYANSRLNATIRHCTIRGFFLGIDFTGSTGGGHLVEDNRFNGNVATALSVEGDGSVIRRNLVFDTGGSTVALSSFGIEAFGSVDVLDNTVSGVVATTGGSGSATGIETVVDNDSTVSGNRIRGLVKDGTGTAFGIYNSFSDRVSVHNNDVVGPGGIGVHCFSGGNTSVKDNVVSGFTTPLDTCIDNGGNSINP